MVTGVITFDAERNPIGKRVVIDEIRNGQILLRKTIDPWKRWRRSPLA